MMMMPVADMTKILTLTLAEQTIKLMRKVEDRILPAKVQAKI